MRGRAATQAVARRASANAGPRGLRLVTWNVNGLRSAARNGFLAWLARCRADAVFLQETRAAEAQLVPALRAPRGWTARFHAAARPGYSGVALYARRRPDEILVGLGMDRFDREGRLISARWGRLIALGGYFPNGREDASRVPYKLEFYAAVLDHAERLRRDGLEPIVLGDFNTAHRPIDLARPRENVENSGFLPEERAELDRWAAAGWIDSFRHVHPEKTGAYSWWTFRSGARQRNVGWRLDQAWIDRALVPRLRAATLHPKVLGSDHCPAGVEIGAGL